MEEYLLQDLRSLPLKERLELIERTILPNIDAPVKDKRLFVSLWDKIGTQLSLLKQEISV